jgi:hypothetical protein
LLRLVFSDEVADFVEDVDDVLIQVWVAAIIRSGWLLSMRGERLGRLAGRASRMQKRLVLRRKSHHRGTRLMRTGTPKALCSEKMLSG